MESLVRNVDISNVPRYTSAQARIMHSICVYVKGVESLRLLRLEIHGMSRGCFAIKGKTYSTLPNIWLDRSDKPAVICHLNRKRALQDVAIIHHPYTVDLETTGTSWLVLYFANLQSQPNTEHIPPSSFCEDEARCSILHGQKCNSTPPPELRPVARC